MCFKMNQSCKREDSVHLLLIIVVAGNNHIHDITITRPNLTTDMLLY